MGKRKFDTKENFRMEKRLRLCCGEDRDSGVCSFGFSDTCVQLQFVGEGRDVESANSSKGDMPLSSVISMERGLSLIGSSSPKELTSKGVSSCKRALDVGLVPSSRKKTSKAPTSHCLDEQPKSALHVSLGQELHNSHHTADVVLAESKVAVLDARTSSSEVDGPFASEALDSPSNEVVECHSCGSAVPSCEAVPCCHKDCRNSYHLSCSKTLKDGIWRRKGSFTCPQHVCYACRRHRSKRLWRCERCPTAVHESCCPWPADMIFFHDNPGWAICWRHSSDRRSALHLQHMRRTTNIKDGFTWLPVPEAVEEFKISGEIRDEVTRDDEPPPYTHIRRNEFLIKKKRDDTDDGVGCKCGEDNLECGDNCECRVQSMSCSKHCVCLKVCTNRPYRKEKKLKIVKTENCGWGAVSAEIIRKGEFIIEYIGEVINDAICEKRLWAMKGKGINKFYMCEIMKDFIIDATYKGNSSRFLNHSCQPNCKLEKWRVDGETRAGVFALRDIDLWEPLTYDYKYVEFGANVKCCCGAPKCRGAIGEKPSSKICWPGSLKWGKKRHRGCTEMT